MTKEQKLNEQVQEQRETIGKLSSRMNEMVDRIVILESDISRFKKTVAKDIKAVMSGRVR